MNNGVLFINLSIFCQEKHISAFHCIIYAYSEDPDCILYAYSEDPDEMSHFICVYTFCIDKSEFQRQIQFYLEIIMCDPSVYTLGHPKFIVSNQKEEPISECLIRMLYRTGDNEILLSIT